MPDRLAYDEAMLFSAARLRIADQDLKRGNVEIVSTKTALGAVERPWGVEGGFAVVYKFRSASGKLRALRCFRVAMNQNMQFRYERLGPFFKMHTPTITADFRYYDTGILVKEQGKSTSQVYPVIDMEWIDGLTLLETVDALCRQHDQRSLEHLVQQWLAILRQMRLCGMAHGDLAAVNVMVRPDGQLVLIDYDGVYIPEFTHLSKVLLGQPDYQHPQVLERNFDAHMDDFSALVIYTALLALAQQPDLWERYARHDEQGHLLDSNLLFTLQDFKAPQQSALFHDLEQGAARQNRRLHQALAALRQACLLPVNDIRFPEQWLSTTDRPSVMPTSFTLQEVRPVTSQPVVVSSLSARPAISRRPGSVRHTSIAPWERSVDELAALHNVHDSAWLHLSPQEQQAAELAATFLTACAQEQDEAIAAAYEAIDNFHHYGAVTFSVSQTQRAKLALQRRSALAHFRVALTNRRPLQIAGAYDDALLQFAPGVTERERQILALTRAFQQAYNEDDEAELIQAYERIQQSPYHAALVFSNQERQLVEQARWQQEIIDTFHAALRTQRPQQIATTYHEILERNQQVTQQEREILLLARDFTQAYTNDDDKALTGVEHILREKHIQFELTASELERIALAQRRYAALQRFQHVLAQGEKNAQHLVAAYDASLLDEYVFVTDEQRAYVASARKYLVMVRALHAALARNDDADIRQLSDPALIERFTDLSTAERKRIQKALLAADVEEALARKKYGTALLLARQIQQETGYPMSPLVTFQLQKATLRFVRQQQIARLRVTVENRPEGAFARVRWQWPVHELVRHAVITWRLQRWPTQLQNHTTRSADEQHIWVERGNQQVEGWCEFPLGSATYLYIQGYSAMHDFWDTRERWFFSDALETPALLALRHTSEENHD